MKKILAVVLALAMVCALSIGVYADGTATATGAPAVRVLRGARENHTAAVVVPVPLSAHSPITTMIPT